MFNTISTLVTTIRYRRPLIINFTNDVTMDFVANGLLSLGASPIMTQASQEIDDLCAIAQAVVINIGTLNDEFIALCKKVASVANRLGIPITLDPVGVGASQYRTKTCLDLLERFKFSIIRGNASEIMALSGLKHGSKGVDSLAATEQAIESAQNLVSRYKEVVIAVSGQTDVVIEAGRVQQFERGSPLMPMVTGSGCLLSSVVSAFDAVHDNSYDAVSAAVVFYGVCGEIAASKSAGPGSFRMHFLDALSSLPESHHYE